MRAVFVSGSTGLLDFLDEPEPGKRRYDLFAQKAAGPSYAHADSRVIIFPYHDEVDRYTLKGALRDADVDLEAFLTPKRQPR